MWVDPEVGVLIPSAALAQALEVALGAGLREAAPGAVVAEAILAVAALQGTGEGL